MRNKRVALVALLLAASALMTAYVSRPARTHSALSNPITNGPAAGPFSDFDVRYGTWLQAQSLTNEQLAALPKTESIVDTVRDASSMLEAVQQADQIVLGVGRAIKFEPYRAIVTFRVEARFKGEGDAAVTVIQSGGLWPDESFRRATLSIDPADPLLLPGTRAILLLRAYPGRPGAFYTEGWTGNLLSAGGTMKAAVGNPFAADVTGRSEGDVSRSLQAAAQSAPPATAAPPAG